MKYLVLICFIIFFSGCSAKCMKNKYDCNTYEKGINSTLDIAGSLAREYNKVKGYSY